MPKKPDVAVMEERDRGGPQRDGDTLLEVRDLKTYFPLRGTFLDRLLGREAGYVRAVDGVTFELRRGEVLGVVGESGSGKTTLGRTILRLVDATDGSIVLEGDDIAAMSERAFRPYRRRVQMIFQDPHASLNPAMTIGEAVAHPLQIHGHPSDDEVDRKVGETLERVGLVPVENFVNKYPGDLSGGQKQRAVIARAIIVGPDLLIADEPVSMLDMSVRAKILELMLGLRSDLGLTYLYITHDLATAKFFCDRIAIMYLGRIVEIGPPSAIYGSPQHPYTMSLLEAIPEPDPTKAIPRDLPRGEIPDAVNPPLGCRFHPRCPKAFEVCGWEARDLHDVLEERWLRMEEEDYEAEQALLADVDELDVPAKRARITPGRGASADDLVAFLDRVRRDEPDARIWKGVRSVRPEAGDAVVEFHDGIDPPLYEAGPVEAACLLHDPKALRRAEELAEGS